MSIEDVRKANERETARNLYSPAHRKEHRVRSEVRCAKLRRSWSARCEVRDVRREVRGARCEVRGVKCEV
jgi:hypothetical protein